MRLVTPLMFSLTTAACESPPREPRNIVLEPAISSGVGSARVFFLHMSVGDDIAGAVARRGVPIVEVRHLPPLSLTPGVVSHASFGFNGDALRKMADFERLFEDAAFFFAPDVALMKLCFDDFDAETDVDLLVDRYRAAVARIHHLSPRTTIVHVTTPLLQSAEGVRDLLKRVSGVGTAGTQANMARARYNEALRRIYANDVIFDLARLQSTRADGSVQAYQRDGRSWPALAPGWSSDGAHLNVRGADRASAALLGAVQRAARIKPLMGRSTHTARMP